MTPPSVFRAIVLKSYETGNTSEMIHIVSGDYGRLSVYAKGLRRPKSPYRALLQPLSLVELSLSLRDGAESGTLREATLIDARDGIVSDFERFSLALVMAEAAALSCDIHQPCPEVFGALLDAFADLLPESGMTAPAAACRGLDRILSVGGYEPQISPELLRPWPADKLRPVCFWIDLESATIHANNAQPNAEPDWPVDVNPAARLYPLPPRAVRFLYEQAQGRDGGDVLAEPEAAQLLEGLIRLFEYHHEGKLKSGEFWRKVRG